MLYDIFEEKVIHVLRQSRTLHWKVRRHLEREYWEIYNKELETDRKSCYAKYNSDENNHNRDDNVFL